MEYVDTKYFSDVMRAVNDGKIFEKFIQNLFCQLKGANFIPMGGIHDMGIDAALYEETEDQKEYKVIYQISIDESRSKILNTLEALQKNKIQYSELFFVTNGIVRKQEDIRSDVFKKYHVLLQIYDLNWLEGNVNTNEGTIRTFQIFVEHYCHEFLEVGKTRLIEDFEGDARIFIFLRQQMERASAIDNLQSLVLDSLIIFSLEGTDPEANTVMTEEDIEQKIQSIAPVRFERKLLLERLKILSTKPRKIKYHGSQRGYCLPYETRREIQAMNIHDAAVVNAFYSSLCGRIENLSDAKSFIFEDIKKDVSWIFNEIFKNNGFEFSNFIMNNNSPQNISQDLWRIIEGLINKKYHRREAVFRERLGGVLMRLSRDLIYSPTSEEKEYFSSLSKTYMTLFMLRADPKIAKYLQTIARGLQVFVCSSILIPALSEIFVPEQDRRLWNLLKMARKAGVKFYITSSILDEIVQHIDNKIKEYRDIYEGNEEIYTDHQSISYIDSILIRGFFYHRMKDPKLTFYHYIDQFVFPNSGWSDKKYELRMFFEEEFEIDFFEREKELLDCVDKKDLSLLTDTLEKYKPSKQQAINDAKTILMIYTKRHVDGEENNGALGFNSWWLSTDTTTFSAVEECLGKNYTPSCYIRPDFLLNFITLSPQKHEIESAYDNIFPCTLGVSLSRHIDGRFTRAIADCLKSHQGFKTSRIRTIIHAEIDQLKSTFQQQGKAGLKRYIEQLYSKVEA